MKLFCTFAVGMLVFLGACKVSGEERGKCQYEHITQDSVGLDLDSGDLRFNDDPVSLERLEEQLQKSYSVSLRAVSFSGGKAVVSSSHLLAVLEMIDHAGIDPKLVRLNLYLPPKVKRNKYHHIELERGGKVVLDGSEIAVADLAEKKLQGHPFVINPKSKSMKADYRQLLSVLRAMGSHAEMAGLGFINYEHVEVEAQIYQLKPDGSRDVLSAPRLSTMPGNSAMIRVVENASGRKTYLPGTDDFHQEDLANLGIRFSVKPQIIGDHIRVSGVVIMTKLIDRDGVFLQGNIPIASYSCSKTVVPFSVVFPPGSEAVVFPVAEVDGKDTMCRLTARVLGKNGMSRTDRERARAMANPSQAKGSIPNGTKVKLF